MSMGPLAIEWHSQIHTMAAQAGLAHVDVIVDQAGWGQSVVRICNGLVPKVPWHSLYSGTPEAHLEADAPILMRIPLGIARAEYWLREVLEFLAGSPRLLVLLSPLPFEALGAELGALTQLVYQQHSGILRYFDPGNWHLLLHEVLNAEQRQRFLQVARCWGWVDRDQRCQWLGGSYTPGHVPALPAKPLQFGHQQMALLGAASEANTLLPWLTQQGLGLNQEATFKLAFTLACQAAEEGYEGVLLNRLQAALTRADLLAQVQP